MKAGLLIEQMPYQNEVEHCSLVQMLFLLYGGEIERSFLQ
jgi:hypothetical protein